MKDWNGRNKATGKGKGKGKSGGIISTQKGKTVQGTLPCSPHERMSAAEGTSASLRNDILGLQVRVQRAEARARALDSNRAPGTAVLRRKQQDRRSKLSEQAAQRRAFAAGTAPQGTLLGMAQSTARKSIEVWQFLCKECQFAAANATEDSRASEDALRRFYNQAYSTGVDEGVVTAAVEAYLADKFEGRVDIACRALFAAEMAGFKIRRRNRSNGSNGSVGLVEDWRGEPVRVASVGGGPGNDAVGFAVYAALKNQEGEGEGGGEGEGEVTSFPLIDVVVYDFCAAWGE